jgi:PAS domain S-box-containing protein
MALTYDELLERTEYLEKRVRELEASSGELKGLEDTLRLNLFELIDSEERYRRLVETAPYGIVIHANGKILFINSTALKMGGFDSLDEVIGTSILDIVHPDSREDVVKRMASRSRTDESEPYAVKLLKKDDSFLYAEAVSIATQFEGQNVAMVFMRDITEQRKAEEALRLSEEKYRMVFEHAPVGVIHFDHGGVITACNDNFVNIMGSYRDEIIGMNLLELPDQNFISAIRNTIHGELGYYEDEYHSTFTAKVTPLRAVFAPIKYADSHFLGGVGIIEDTTEQKQVVNALLESEARFRNLVEAAPYGIIVHDVDAKIVYINPFGIQLAAYKNLEEAIGESVIRRIHPNSRAAVIKRFQKLLQDRKSMPTTEEKLIRKTGEVRYGEVTSMLSQYEGEEAGYAFFHDITDRKNAEDSLKDERRRLEVTLRSIGDGVIATDAEGNIVLLNQVAEQLTGWTQEEALGNYVDTVFHIINELVRNRCDSPIGKVLQTGSTVEHEKATLLISKDGTERVTAYTSAPIKDIDNRIIGVVLAFRDITEKQRIEAELQKSQRLESVGILAGGIAHDFNNILTAIVGSINMAKMYEEHNEMVTKILNEAEKASFRARDLTQQLLTFSKGGMPVKKITSISNVIKDSANFVLHGTRVRCEFHIPDTLWAAEVDPGQISQVIQNIVMNAEQALQDGGIIHIYADNKTLTAGEIPALQAGKYITISIIDHGRGISAEIMPKIFDPYFTTKSNGTGLGLTIAYSIIKKHDGSINVFSKVNEGTTFTIHLPAYGEYIPEHTVTEKEAFVGKGKILIMDDEELIRNVVQELLGRLGYEVETAKDGKAAVEIYKKALKAGKPFDLAILDLTVPGGIGGKECVDTLKKINPGIKAIVSSGYSNNPIMSDYNRYGFSGVIVKPYRLSDLIEVLQNNLNKEDV